MPPRNKKKSKKSPIKSPIPKRKQIEDEDGWTHIVGPHQQKVRESIDTNTVYIERSITEMSTQHEKVLLRWQESEARQVLLKELEDFSKREDGVIKKVVCLGLGTMQNGNFTQQNNRHAQLAALLDLVEVLGGMSQLKVLAQDPVFGSGDKDFLNHLGVQVVESPLGFEAIDRETLVYAVHCHEELYEEVSKGARPAGVIGNDLEELCGSKAVSEWLKPFADDYRDTSIEPVLSKRKERTDSFDQVFYSAFYATRLYLRKSSQDQEPVSSMASADLQSSLPHNRGGGASTSLLRHALGASDDSGQALSVPEGSGEEGANGQDFEIFEDPEDAPTEPTRGAVEPQQEDTDSDDEDNNGAEDKENCPPEPSQSPEPSQQAPDGPAAAIAIPNHLQEMVDEYTAEHREPLANKYDYYWDS